MLNAIATGGMLLIALGANQSRKTHNMHTLTTPEDVRGERAKRTLTLRRLQVRHPLFDLACDRLDKRGSDPAVAGVPGVLSNARGLGEPS